MCGIPRASSGSPRIIIEGRHLVYQGMYGQFAYPEHKPENILAAMKPVYAINVRRKPVAYFWGEYGDALAC
jgi:hypothetical protein